MTNTILKRFLLRNWIFKLFKLFSSHLWTLSLEVTRNEAEIFRLLNVFVAKCFFLAGGPKIEGLVSAQFCFDVDFRAVFIVEDQTTLTIVKHYRWNYRVRSHFLVFLRLETRGNGN